MQENYLSQLSQNQSSIITASNAMDSTLLITGSTGTGKSHLAKSIHAMSRRNVGRWYKVNLATLSENIIESELFGHERGAFTGADTRRVGRLEICNNGTIFLDEIGELSLRLQAKLLDFIQYKRISPVGSNREIDLNVRIIAATNRNLELAVKKGEFRADLYHRLNVFHVRLSDLALNPRVVVDFARKFVAEKSKLAEKKILGLTRPVEKLFRQYPWPGNIRELENTIEFAVAIEQMPQIRIESLPSNLQDFCKEKCSDLLQISEELILAGDEKDLGAEVQANVLTISPTPAKSYSSDAIACLELPMTLNFHETKDHFERAYLEQALRLCGGQINLTSRRIGLNKVSLTDKIKKYEINWRKIRYDSSLRTSSTEMSVMHC